MLSSSLLLSLAAASFTAGMAIRATAPIWLTLPPTPDLPAPISNTTYSINGIEMWAQKYNEDVDGIPLVLDHGGLGYSAYFGSVITYLVNAGHYVIVVDRRGHGRSTFNADDTFTYEQMAKDIYDLLNVLKVPKYNVVGWSDGGITTLQALINSSTAAPIQKAFIYGASALPEQTNATFSDTDIFQEFVARCRQEYGELQPTANFTSFATKVGTMEGTLPQWNAGDLANIDGTRLMIVGGEYEEAVNLDVPEILHSSIPGSTLKILTNVSHFAPMQDPVQFTQAVEDWFF